MTATIPPLVAGLCDDAAVFPPGRASLPDAVHHFLERRGTWFADLAGPLVVPDGRLDELADLLPAGAGMPLSVTLPAGPDGLAGVLARTADLPVHLCSVEVAVPDGASAAGFLDALAGALPERGGPDVYVEIPRDQRRALLVEAIAGRYRAKFRTGGLRADLHPDEAELAGGLAAVVAAGVAFKATAGLHHAVRHTDSATGFEQHGFLNVLLATDALIRGGTEGDARTLLAERDGPTVAGPIREWDAGRVRRARAAFRSFGTCSITDPLTDLIDLGVCTAPSTEGALP